MSAPKGARHAQWARPRESACELESRSEIASFPRGRMEILHHPIVSHDCAGAAVIGRVRWCGSDRSYGSTGTGRQERRERRASYGCEDREYVTSTHRSPARAESYILASLQHPSEPSTQPVGGCVGVIHTHTYTHTHSQSWLVTCPYVIGTRPATEFTAGQFHVTVSYLYSLPSLPLCERACFARRARKGSLGRARKRGGAAHTAPLHTNSHPPSPFVGAGEYPGGIGRAAAPVASLRRAEAPSLTYLSFGPEWARLQPPLLFS